MAKLSDLNYFTLIVVLIQFIQGVLCINPFNLKTVAKNAYIAGVQTTHNYLQLSVTDREMHKLAGYDIVSNTHAQD